MNICSICKIDPSVKTRLLTINNVNAYVKFCLPCYYKYFTVEGWYQFFKTKKDIENAISEKE